MTDARKEMLELAARLVIAADILKRHPCEVVYLERDCRAAAEALRSPSTLPAPEPQRGTWQPIETAPKDGRTIEVKYLTDDPRKVRWSQSSHGTTWHLTGAHAAAVITFEPTHWRPLPAAPERQRTEG